MGPSSCGRPGEPGAVAPMSYVKRHKNDAAWLRNRNEIMWLRNQVKVRAVQQIQCANMRPYAVTNWE